MYNYLKLGAFIMAGRYLKPRLKGLIVLLAFWFVLRFLHSEYLGYVELTDDTRYLVAATLTKIALYITAFLLYVFLVERKILLHARHEVEARQQKTASTSRDDGFDFIRQKKKLSTPADQLLKKE